MKKILIAILYFIHFYTAGPAQSPEEFGYKDILVEIEWFIQKTKPLLNQEGLHDVYLIKIIGETSDRCCFTLEIVSDSPRFAGLNGFKHYSMINNELVLFSFSDEFSKKYVHEFKGVELLHDSKIIYQKFIPGIVFFGTTPGYVCCYEAKNIVKIYYFNSNDIPLDKRIFNYVPQGESILVDSTSMRQIFKKKKK